MIKSFAIFALGFVLLAPSARAADLIDVPVLDEDVVAAELEAGADFDAEAAVEESDLSDGVSVRPFPPHRPPHHQGRFVCTARNLRGAVFYGRGRQQVRAQQRALDNCYRAGSARCNVVACHFQF